LLKQGAKLVESAQDVLEELRLQLTPPLVPPSKLLKTESEDADDEVTAIEPDDLVKSLGYDPVSLDALVARTGWDAASLQVRLMELELDGQVARLPGDGCGLNNRSVIFITGVTRLFDWCNFDQIFTLDTQPHRNGGSNEH
jgi:predicted Rossmann fold nucleotide-binding protein DprA/Smf involved in DNA uptake